MPTANRQEFFDSSYNASYDLESDESGPSTTESSASQASPAVDDHIKRPRNVWFIYLADKRKEHNEEVRKALEARKKSNDDKSHKVLELTMKIPEKEFVQIVSAEWKKESQDRKEKYYAKAKVETEQHRRNHPEYVYRPKKSSKKGNEGKGNEGFGSMATGSGRRSSSASVMNEFAFGGRYSPYTRRSRLSNFGQDSWGFQAVEPQLRPLQVSLGGFSQEGWGGNPASGIGFNNDPVSFTHFQYYNQPNGPWNGTPAFSGYEVPAPQPQQQDLSFGQISQEQYGGYTDPQSFQQTKMLNNPAEFLQGSSTGNMTVMDPQYDPPVHWFNGISHSQPTYPYPGNWSLPQVTEEETSYPQADFGCVESFQGDAASWNFQTHLGYQPYSSNTYTGPVYSPAEFVQGSTGGNSDMSDGVDPFSSEWFSTS